MVDVLPETVIHVAQELHLPIEGLMTRSLRAFLMQEMRSAQMDIADLQDRYGVIDTAELRDRIERQEISSHPAWEDAMEWEHLEAYLARVQDLLNEISDV